MEQQLINFVKHPCGSFPPLTTLLI